MIPKSQLRSKVTEMVKAWSSTNFVLRKFGGPRLLNGPQDGPLPEDKHPFLDLKLRDNLKVPQDRF